MSDRTEQLGESEAWYVAEVTGHVRKLPEAERSTLLAVLRDNLSERPPSASRAELLDALGSPADYADRLRRDAGPPDAARAPRRHWSLRRVGLGLAVVAVVLAGWFSWRWWTAEPGIYNSCAGVSGQPPEVTVEQRDAGRVERAPGRLRGRCRAVAPHVPLVGGSRDHRRRRARRGRVHAVRAHGPPQARADGPRRPEPWVRAVPARTGRTAPTACSSCTSTVGSPTASTTKREAATRSPMPR